MATSGDSNATLQQEMEALIVRAEEAEKKYEEVVRKYEIEEATHKRTVDDLTRAADEEKKRRDDAVAQLAKWEERAKIAEDNNECMELGMAQVNQLHAQEIERKERELEELQTNFQRRLDRLRQEVGRRDADDQQPVSSAPDSTPRAGGMTADAPEPAEERRRREKRIDRLIRSIDRCDGSNPALFRAWIKNLDTVNAKDGTMVLEAAEATATGELGVELSLTSDLFLWSEQREHLITHFVGDLRSSAEAEMSSLRQREGESTVAFFAQFQALARDVYGNVPSPDAHRTILHALYRALLPEVTDELVRLYGPETLTAAGHAIRQMEKRSADVRASQPTATPSRRSARTAAVTTDDQGAKSTNGDEKTMRQMFAALQNDFKQFKESTRKRQEKSDTKTPAGAPQDGAGNGPTDGRTPPTRPRPVTHGPTMRCFNCGGLGHPSRRCPRPPTAETMRIRDQERQQFLGFQGNAPGPAAGQQ